MMSDNIGNLWVVRSQRFIHCKMISLDSHKVVMVGKAEVGKE